MVNIVKKYKFEKNGGGYPVSEPRFPFYIPMGLIVHSSSLEEKPIQFDQTHVDDCVKDDLFDILLNRVIVHKKTKPMTKKQYPIATTTKTKKIVKKEI